MKRIIFAATSFAAMAMAGSAFAANSQTTTAFMQGNVPDTCVLTAPTVTASTNATNVLLGGNGGQSTMLLTLADANTAKLNAVSFTLTYADSYCNYNHSVGIKATNGGLIASDYDPVATSGAFIRRIGYDADIKWMGPAFAQGPNPGTSTTTDLGDTLSTAAVNFPVAGANRADLVIQVTIDNSNQTPVVSGTYTEYLTLKIGATL
ncbi:MAG: hypothetical protein FD163_574 [Hyphomonadaceae bacterium]|nr:MAG: hypothetical protein FD128_2767 [Hyphomonadaceae bacterium]KAF0185906.1 MAG: hypothetical protein FD163_574 [Hyphomonadaceae bacterium]